MWIAVLFSCVPSATIGGQSAPIVAPEATDSDSFGSLETDSGFQHDENGSLVECLKVAIGAAWTEGGDPQEQWPPSPPLSSGMLAMFGVPPGNWVVGALSPDSLDCWLSEPVEIAAGEQIIWDVREFPGDAEIAEDGRITCIMP